MPRTLDEIDSEIESQGTLVRVLKAQNKESPSDDLKLRIAAEVDKLKKLKAEREPIAAAAEAARKKDEFDRAGLESMLLKRFFYAPSFSIYGGVAGLYDYGPPGCALQNNILSLWRSHFVLEEDMLEVECTNLTPESVLKTSGHVERFADWMVRDLQTGDIFRADHLVKQVLNQRLSDDEALQNGAVGAADKKAKKGQQPKGEKLTPEMRKQYELILEQLDNYQGDDLHKLIQQYQIKAPETGNELSKPVQFNLMFETQIGPTGQFKGFLRPETAQGHFLNFKKLLEFNTDQMPFASASIGKSFRNEISPRQGLLRVREFTMAEIEHYVDPNNKKHPRFHEVKDIVIPLYSAANQLENKGLVEMSIGEAVEKGIVNNETLGYFVARIYLFLVRIGIDRKRLRFRQHMANEMAHYACDCWDAEIKSSYGWIECVGCADRSAFDLSAHSKATREKLVVREALPEPVMRERWVLEINKPKFGPAFKKNAKFVTGYIESLMTGDDEWDELKLQQLQSDLEKGDGKVTVTGTDGNPYELTKDMVQIYLKKEKISVREYIPNVIEPSFGIGRILYSLIEHSYYIREGDEQRGVLKFPPVVAPFKALVLPISRNEEFVPFIGDIVTGLRRRNISNKVDDSSGSIGRRYARNDELGTPFAVTVDFQTVKDGSVTLRERDSLKQIRESIPTILDIIKDLVEERTTWEEVVSKYPTFVAQEL